LLVVRDVRTQLAEGFVIAGDPERCVDTIQKWREAAGLTAISGTFHFGGMPQEMAMKNIRLFAERVMPQFK
jgi:alkanesulfonate monooxygenase SsuD/methylene tetrahydromethanopterin reductase-like flavin-dependent oxidoreductase (luciferase family)